MHVVKSPKFVGKKNDWASQGIFYMQIYRELRHRSQELAQRGGILLNSELCLPLAQRAKMKHDLIPKVIDCWVSENYLEEVEPNVFNVGSKEPDAKAMLMAAGNTALEFSRLALKGAKAKQKEKLSKNKKNFPKKS